jgi:hypothetical protein
MRSPKLLFLAIIVSCIAFSCVPETSDPDDDQNNDLPADPQNLLTDKTYRKLVINLAFAPGTSFRGRNAFSFVESRISKSNVLIRFQNVPSIGKSSVTVADLQAYEQQNRTKTTNGDTIFLWVPIVDAELSPDPAPNIALGLAYGPTSMAIFGKKLNQLALPDMVSRWTLEDFVFQHEFSHLLGLTNNGTPMVTPHQDTEHGNHCSNPDCLMYWRALDNIKLVDILDNSGTSDQLPYLDAKCLADLQAAGGK